MRRLFHRIFPSVEMNVVSTGTEFLNEWIYPSSGSSWGDSPLWWALWGDLAATVGVFLISVLVKNSSVYDPYWSVAPVIIAFYWTFEDPNASVSDGWVPQLQARQWLVLILINAWGHRLTWSWWKRLGYDMSKRIISGKPAGHEDWRYVLIRQGLTGTTAHRVSLLKELTYWIVGSLGAIHMFPTIMVFFGMVPAYLVLGRPAVDTISANLGWLDAVAIVLGIEAVWLELAADLQMDAFLASASAKEGKAKQVCRRGLWAVSRHPNYLGENLMWLSLGLFALAAHGTRALLPALLGFVGIMGIFVGFSIPQLEARQRERRGAAYEQYQREVGVFLPASTSLYWRLLPGVAVE